MHQIVTAQSPMTLYFTLYLCFRTKDKLFLSDGMGHESETTDGVTGRHSVPQV